MKQIKDVLKKIKEQRNPLKGYAVVLNRSLSSIYNPNDWFGCYTIFNKKEDAEYWLKNKARNDGKIIKVIIYPY